MAYSGVYVFGDSLVDSGNALKLAETYDYFPFTSLPNGAPTSEKGYHSGNFTNGWTYADLISNKFLSVTTKTVFPFGYDEPFLGISFGFVSDPSGNNLNFAYGGAQLRQGEEAVPDIDDQTDAFRDAVDGDADPGALYLFSFGANDVHDLVPKQSAWVSRAAAEQILDDAAGELIEEILQTIEIGARHIIVTGIPDIGIQPYYNGTPDEALRRAAATEYADLLDDMIQARLAALNLPAGVDIHYVSFDSMQAQVITTMASLYGASEIFPLEDSNEVFFDLVHPTAQVHALGAAYMLDQLGIPAGEQAPVNAWNYELQASIGARGEVDSITIALAASTQYVFQLFGVSTLGGSVTTLADPMLKIYRPDGTLAASNDDGGLGLDSSLTFTTSTAGEYRIDLSGVGMMTGSYVFHALGAANGDNSYLVSKGSTVVLEGPGGGLDTVRTSVSYALNQGSEVEVLRTTNDLGKAVINLTGNEYGQTIVGNSASNILDGREGSDKLFGGSGADGLIGGAGDDFLTGGGGTDRFVFGPGSGNDHIADFSRREVIAINGVGGIDTFSDLTIVNMGGSAVVSWGTGDSITLDGVRPSTLSAADFSFNDSSTSGLASAQLFGGADKHPQMDYWF